MPRPPHSRLAQRLLPLILATFAVLAVVAATPSRSASALPDLRGSYAGTLGVLDIDRQSGAVVQDQDVPLRFQVSSQDGLTIGGILQLRRSKNQTETWGFSAAAESYVGDAQNGAAGFKITLFSVPEFQQMSESAVSVSVIEGIVAIGGIVLLESPATFRTVLISVQRVPPIKLWVDAFIPRTIKNLTRVIPSGPFAGSTAIPGPAIFPGYFLTDQRSFSTDINASARLKSTITIDPTDPTSFQQEHRCNETIAYNVTFDTLIGRAVGDASRSSFQLVSSDDTRTKYRLEGAASNPVIPGSPDIDYQLDIELSRAVSKKGGSPYTLAVNGLVEPFPAFEMYAGFEGRKPTKLFALNPLKGASPWDLIGDPNRGVAKTIRLK
jgi:hypothetical protein